MKKLLKTTVSTAADILDNAISSHFRMVSRTRVHTLLEQEILKKLIAFFQVDCIFDVGANRGQYACMLRQKVGYTGHIISFEPIPHCAAHLKAMSRRDSKWHVEQMALSDAVGETTFNVMTNTTFSSLSSPKSSDFDLSREGNRVEEVIKVTLDTLVRQYDLY